MHYQSAKMAKANDNVLIDISITKAQTHAPTKKIPR
jgi:hypothetical protein